MSRYSSYDSRGGPPRDYGWDHRDSWADRSGGGGGASGGGSGGGDWHRPPPPDWDEPRRGSGAGGRYEGGGYDRDYHHPPGRDHHRMSIDDRRDDWRNHPHPPPSASARQDWHHREDRMDWEPPRSHLRKRDQYDDGRDYGRDYRGRGPPPPTSATGSAEDTDWKRRKVDLDQWDDHGPTNDRPPATGPRNRMEPSEPSQHVIFLGMDPDFVEADLHAYLVSIGVTVDSVTVIRDRVTGQSRGFGFAQFPSVQEASAFLLPNFPFIHIPPVRPPPAHSTYHNHHPNGRRVKIDFSSSPPESSGSHHNSGSNANAGGSQGGAGPGGSGYNNRRKGDPNSPATAKNDGTRDIGSAQTAVLLFRSLDKLNTKIEDVEEALKGTTGGSTAVKRILLVKDKLTAVGWGFAFIEFTDTEAASSAFASIMSPQTFPTGFRILDQVVAASFALPYAFQLLPPGSEKQDGCVTPSKAVGGTEEEGCWTRYWDEAAVVEEKTFDVVIPPSSGAAEKEEDKAGKKEKDKKDKKKVKDEEDTKMKDDSASAAPVATTISKTAGPISLKFGKAANQQASSGTTDVKQSGGSGGPAVPNALGFSADGDGDQPMADSGTSAGAGESGGAKAGNAAATSSAANKAAATKKNVAPMVGNAKTAKNINKWNANKETAAAAAEPATTSTTPTTTTAAAAGATTGDSPNPENHNLKPGDKGFEYSDPVALTCLLCLRQLKTLHQLQRHNTESEMHKANLKNNKLCKVAKEKVASAKKFLEAEAEAAANEGSSSGSAAGDKKSDEPAPKYRDRAEERRKIHNQPEVPLPAASSSGVNTRGQKNAVAIAPAPTRPAAPIEPAKDDNNVGNKLLKKMGWSEGGGLGVEGEGRVEPIKTAVYAAGVGLGAAKPKEVTSFAAGGSSSGGGGGNSYAEAAKESARERMKS